MYKNLIIPPVWRQGQAPVSLVILGSVTSCMSVYNVHLESAWSKMNGRPRYHVIIETHALPEHVISTSCVGLCCLPFWFGCLPVDVILSAYRSVTYGLIMFDSFLTKHNTKVIVCCLTIDMGRVELRTRPLLALGVLLPHKVPLNYRRTVLIIMC